MRLRWRQSRCFQLFRFEVIGERAAGKIIQPRLGETAFPTIPIWSNRWTFRDTSSMISIVKGFQLFRFEVIGEQRKAVYDSILVPQFPTIPIWSNRWTISYFWWRTSPKSAIRFQLFRFEVIGERRQQQHWLQSPESPGFQLFRFEVIGERSRSKRDAWRNDLRRSFQLFRFEVIGERQADYKNGSGGVTITVSNYSDLK